MRDLKDWDEPRYFPKLEVSQIRFGGEHQSYLDKEELIRERQAIRDEAGHEQEESEDDELQAG